MIINPFRTKQNGLGDTAMPISMPQETSGIEPKTMTAFTQRLNNMPDALKTAIASQKAEVFDRVIYSVHVNKTGNYLKLIGGEISKQDGICNFDKGKMPSNEYFFFEKIKIVGKQFTLANGATEVPVEDVVKSTYGEVSALILNSFLNIKIGAKTMVDEMPLCVLTTKDQQSGSGVPVGVYRFGTGFLVSPNETFDAQIKVPENFSMSDKNYAIRLELHGVGAKIVS